MCHFWGSGNLIDRREAYSEMHGSWRKLDGLFLGLPNVSLGAMPALTIRVFSVLALLYLFVSFFAARPALHDESESYYNYGKNLFSTGVYGQTPGQSDNFREPGYGTFLAIALLPVQKASLATQLRFVVMVQALFFLAVLAIFLRFAELPTQVKSGFALLSLLSPTLWGAHADIYSETITISIAILFITIASRSDFARARIIALATMLTGWLSITKLYLMYFFPIAFLVFLPWKKFRLMAVPPLFALICLAGWSQRANHVDHRADPDLRAIIQLAGKVYRPAMWDFRTEWKSALLASCCLNTCIRRYGAAACDKFTWTVSDNIAYGLIQDWKDHPERHEPNLLHEVLHHWWRTLPTQIVGSGLELFRMMFFEAAPVWPDSPSLWRLFAQLWHLGGSLLLWGCAIAGARVVAHSPHLGMRRVGVLATLFLVYHFAFMAQVTTVQRYTQPVIPYLYFFAAAFLQVRQRID